MRKILKTVHTVSKVVIIVPLLIVLTVLLNFLDTSPQNVQAQCFGSQKAITIEGGLLTIVNQDNAQIGKYGVLDSGNQCIASDSASINQLKFTESFEDMRAIYFDQLRPSTLFNQVTLPPGPKTQENILLDGSTSNPITPTAIPTPIPTPGSTTLSISPSATSVQAGQTFTVDLDIYNAINLGAYQVTLGFDANVVEFVSADVGPFLTSTGRSAFSFPPLYPSPGNVTVGAYTGGQTPPGPNGAGTVGIYTFRARTAGGTNLSLSNGLISGVSEPQTLGPVTGGTITVTTVPTATSVPSIYRIQGDLTVNDDFTGSTTGVIFVEGKLTINSNIAYGSSKNGLMFIVRDDVNISSNVTQVNAYIVTFGQFCSAYDSDDSCPAIKTSKLVVNGSVIALNGNKPPKFVRYLDNNTDEAEKINFEPKYLVILRGVFARDSLIWNEIY